MRLQIASETVEGRTVGRIRVTPATRVSYPDSMLRHTDLSPVAALGKLDASAIIHFWYGSDKIAAKAIREGRQAARAVDEFLMGSSDLPR